MYNTLFGVNSMAKLALYMAGFEIKDIERFRDAIIIDEDGTHYVEILTRTGGPNKNAYPNKKLMYSKQLVKCYDDSYDSTYQHYIFRVHDYFELNLDWEKVMTEQNRNSLNLKDMFEKEMQDANVEGTPAYNRAHKIAKGLAAVLENGDTSKATIVTVDELMKLGENSEDN